MAKNELVIASKNTFKNSELTQRIGTLDKIASGLATGIEDFVLLRAKTLAEIEADGIYKEDYESCTDLIIQLYGLSRANAYDILKVGHAIRNKKLPEVDAQGKKFSFTQLRAIVRAKDPEKLSAEVATGSINADMTEKETIARVKDINPERKAPKQKLYDFVETVSNESSTMTEDSFVAWLTEKASAHVKVKANENVYYLAIDANENTVAFRMEAHTESVEAK